MSLSALSVADHLVVNFFKLENLADKPFTRSQRTTSTSSAGSTKSNRRPRESSTDSDNLSETPSDKSNTQKKRKTKTSTMPLVDNKNIMDKLNEMMPSIVKIDSIDLKVDGLAQQLAAMENRVTVLETSTNNNTATVNVLNNHVHSLQGQVNKLQQQVIANEVLLHGLPPSVTVQDVPAVLAAFGLFVGHPLTPEDFCHPPRVFTNKNRTSATIIGTFKSNELKVATMKAFKAKRPVPVEDVVNLPALSTLRGKLVTIRNSLTPAYRHILTEAHRIKEGVFDYAWDSMDGRILLRKDGNSRPIEICSIAELHLAIDKERNNRM